MVAKPKHDHPPARPARDAARADLITVLDALLRFSPRLRRCLRDYPADGPASMPVAPRDIDILLLIDAGFLTSKRVARCITPLGILAQEEIWAAEQQVARLLSTFTL